MKCGKCGRDFLPPPTIERVIQRVAQANGEPKKALKLVCVNCLKPQPQPQPKELPRGN